MDTTPIQPIPNNLGEVHHIHHNDLRNPTISVKLERNTKGYSFEISISGANSTQEALDLLDEVAREMEIRYPLAGKG